MHKQSNITTSDLHVVNVACLYQLHLRDLSLELILFQPAMAASDSADVVLPATHVPFHTTAAF